MIHNYGDIIRGQLLSTLRSVEDKLHNTLTPDIRSALHNNLYSRLKNKLKPMKNQLQLSFALGLLDEANSDRANNVRLRLNNAITSKLQNLRNELNNCGQETALHGRLMDLLQASYLNKDVYSEVAVIKPEQSNGRIDICFLPTRNIPGEIIELKNGKVRYTIRSKSIVKLKAAIRQVNTYGKSSLNSRKIGKYDLDKMKRKLIIGRRSRDCGTSLILDPIDAAGVSIYTWDEYIEYLERILD